MAGGGGFNENAVMTPINKIYLKDELRNINVEGMVITKSELRAVVKYDGTRENFSFTLRDKTGDIEVVAFEGIDCEDLNFQQLFTDITLNRYYRISKVTIIRPNRDYKMCQHKCQLSVSKFSAYESIDAPTHITPFEYPFQAINDLDLTNGEPASILGVLVFPSNLKDKQRQGQPITLRDIQLIDQSGGQIEVSLWEHEARNFTYQSIPEEPVVVYLYGARVKEFEGNFKLDTAMNSMLLVNPNIPQAATLRQWFISRAVLKPEQPYRVPRVQNDAGSRTFHDLFF